jgi:molybdate transport system regulatory protein
MHRNKRTFQYAFRLYLNVDGKRVLGKGGAQILEAIDRQGSITAAAKELHMSYKFVWDYLTRMSNRLNKPVIVTRRGGTRHRKRKGGGGTRLTPLANALLKNYRATENRLHATISKTKIRLAARSRER